MSLVGMLPVADLWAHLLGFGPWQLHLLGAFVGFVALLGPRDSCAPSGRRTAPWPYLWPARASGSSE